MRVGEERRKREQENGENREQGALRGRERTKTIERSGRVGEEREQGAGRGRQSREEA